MKKILRKNYVERQTKRRKASLKSIIFSKRNSDTQRKMLIQYFFVKEGNEVKGFNKRELAEKGHLCLNQHHKGKKKKIRHKGTLGI